MIKIISNRNEFIADKKIILNIRDLKKWFPVRKKWFMEETQYVKAIDGISLYVKQGETLGIVGESGCGKTTLARIILGLTEPTFGEIFYNNKELIKLNKKQIHKIKGEIQIIFQDPYSSLNPRMTVGNIISEPLDIQTKLSRQYKLKRVIEMMEICGLDPVYIRRYPHEFSGGQRQRIGIARSLVITPQLLICDEPVSALDVSIQSQIINLLMDLQEELELSYIFISHDLSVIYHIADRVAVMYLGKIVEIANKNDLYDNPLHPYTKTLIKVVPNIGLNHKSKKIILKGDAPSPINPPSGCSFHPRCPEFQEICSKKPPNIREIGIGHSVSCHFAQSDR